MPVSVSPRKHGVSEPRSPSSEMGRVGAASACGRVGISDGGGLTECPRSAGRTLCAGIASFPLHVLSLSPPRHPGWSLPFSEPQFPHRLSFQPHSQCPSAPAFVLFPERTQQFPQSLCTHCAPPWKALSPDIAVTRSSSTSRHHSEVTSSGRPSWITPSVPLDSLVVFIFTHGTYCRD